jgi:hypothetical protein
MTTSAKTTGVEGALVTMPQRTALNHLLIRVVLIESGALLVALILILIMAFRAPIERYFTTLPDGRIVAMEAASVPVVNRNAVSTFAGEAFGSVYGYDFAKYRAQIQQAAEFFTESGYSSYQNQLQQSGNLAAVTQKKLTVTATVTGPIVVTRQGLVGSRFKWDVEFPASLTYESSSERFRQDVLVTMRVTRLEPKEITKRAIAIDFIQIDRGSR